MHPRPSGARDAASTTGGGSGRDILLALSDDGGEGPHHVRRTPGNPLLTSFDRESNSSRDASDDTDTPSSTRSGGFCAMSVGQMYRDPGTRALLFYFVSSIALTIFNKWFFSSHNQLGFHFPLTVTCIHQFCVYVLVVLTEDQLLTRGFGEIVRAPGLRLPLGTLGAFCGIDWGLSNLSLRYIPLSLYEMTKSASPAMVLILSAGFGLLVFTKRIATIVILVCAGMFLSVSGGSLKVFSADSFPMFGFVCVATATFISGGRIVYAQYALQRLTVTPAAASGDAAAAAAAVAGPGSGVNAVTMLYYSAPFSAGALVLPALYLEGAEIEQWHLTATRATVLKVALAIITSASIAYALSLSEFFATRQTSALTLCVVGVTKQLLLIGLAMAIFGDRLGITNVAGFVIALLGVSLYNYAKKTGAMARQGQQQLLPGAGGGTVASSSANESISLAKVNSGGAFSGGSSPLEQGTDELRLGSGSGPLELTPSVLGVPAVIPGPGVVPAHDAHLRARGGTGLKK